MHILQLVNFHSPTSGGIKVALGHFASGYVNAGHRCTQIRPAERDGSFREDGVDVITVRSPVIPGLGGYRMILSRHRVIEQILELQPDSIELSDKTTLVSASSVVRRRGIPVILYSHERLDHVVGSVVGSSRLVSAALDRYRRRLLANVDAVVCASEFAADEFSDGCSVPMYRVPLGVDLALFRPSGEQQASRSDVLRLVSVVRLSPEKNPEVLLAAVRELVRRGRRVLLDIYGTGSLHERIAAEIHRERLPIRLHGHLSDRQQLSSSIAAADLVLAPGSRETFGLAALEALACGVPVVVPDRGALSELVMPGIGAVADSSGEAFADAVEAVVGESGFPETHRRRAREAAERFTWARAVEGMLGVHADVSSSTLALR